MDIAKKLQLVQMAYVGIVADSVLQLGREGVLEKVTERKKAEQMAMGKAKVDYYGIHAPEDVFLNLSEVFNCADWKIRPGANGFTAEAADCKLCATAKRIGAPSPCNIYCLNPMEGMVKGLNPNALFEVKETLWSGQRCRVEVKR